MSDVLVKPWVLRKALNRMASSPSVPSGIVRRVWMGLMAMAIEIGGALLVIAIVVGTIAVPVFMSTNTSGWSATNVLIWGTILTIAFAALIMGIIALFKRASGE
jgi:hypothetical protein